MAPKKDTERDPREPKKTSKKNQDKQEEPTLRKETIRSIAAIVSFVLVLFFSLSAFGKAGRVGQGTYEFFTYLFGWGYWLLPILALLLAISFLRSEKNQIALTHSVGGVLFFISGLSLLTIFTQNAASGADGGVVGAVISSPLVNLFDVYASTIILFAVACISLLVMFDIPLSLGFLWPFRTKESEKEDTEPVLSAATAESLKKAEEMAAKAPETPTAAPAQKPKEEMGFGFGATTLSGKDFTAPPLDLLEKDRGKPGVGDIKANSNIIKRTLANFGINVEMDEISIGPSITRYALKPAEGVKLSRIVGLQNDLSLALAAHPLRIEAPIPGKSLVGIEIPNTSKTTVGLGTLLGSSEFQDSDKPLLMALGKGISGTAYFDNLATAPHMLVAGATGAGKSVTIHAIITSLLYRNSPDNLKFIMVDPKRVELTLYNKIPHLLTPVITDAKKTILALKWAAKEMDRRYDILQEKGLQNIESYHKNIVAPAIKKLKEKKGKGEEGLNVETMPYIVVVIDELADIMQAFPRELEAGIVRLAQMSRAVGIHLILSTQRPSVNVITGLIKANIPTRLALQVASQIDSRTILDMAGAEKLLGAGDMLYLNGKMSQPSRIQSAYISENEVKSVVKWLAENYMSELGSTVNIDGQQPSTGDEAVGPNAAAVNALNAERTAAARNGFSMPNFDDMSVSFDDSATENEDELYGEARTTVIQAGKASTSFLQRKLGVGYARAARLMDMLEEQGVIGPGSGAKPREVLVKPEQ